MLICFLARRSSVNYELTVWLELRESSPKTKQNCICRLDRNDEEASEKTDIELNVGVRRTAELWGKLGIHRVKRCLELPEIPKSVRISPGNQKPLQDNLLLSRRLLSCFVLQYRFCSCRMGRRSTIRVESLIGQ